MTEYFLLLRTNDYATGQCTGTVDAIEVYREEGTHNGSDRVIPAVSFNAAVGVPFSASDESVSVDGRVYPVTRHVLGVGNQAWRGAWMAPQSICDLLNHLHRSEWEADVFLEALSQRWEAGEPFLCEDWRGWEET